MTNDVVVAATPARPPRKPPLKQKMALSLKSLVSSVFGAGTAGTGPAPMGELFAKTDPAVDGEACLHDCASCGVRYPRGFKVNDDDELYGHVKAWSTHLLVGTGKTDWVRDVADEKGSVMEAVSKLPAPTNGRMMLSASNLPTPHNTADYSEPTTALLLPAFAYIHNVTPANAGSLVTHVVNRAPTTASPLRPGPRSDPAGGDSLPSSWSLSTPLPDGLSAGPCPHAAVILLCSQRTRDARCGQSAPLLRKELERHLRPLGLYRDAHDERPGGVGIYFISHVGGHAYSANVMVYRRPNAFGKDDETPAVAPPGSNGDGGGVAESGDDADADVGAAQCIWLARVAPPDCENLVNFTVLKGKVVKPEDQLRGGFDRAKGLMSW